VFSNRSTVKVLLTKAKNLKQSDRYKTVFISPDRSLQERETHKKLILQLKSKRDNDRETHHFIRDGVVCSVRKTDNRESVWNTSCIWRDFMLIVNCLHNLTLVR
jgi:hypothetical protein